MYPWRVKMPTQNIVDVAVADEDRVGNNLLQIWTLRFGQKAKLLFRQDLQLEFGQFLCADVLKRL